MTFVDPHEGLADLVARRLRTPGTPAGVVRRRPAADDAGGPVRRAARLRGRPGRGRGDARHGRPARRSSPPSASGSSWRSCCWRRTRAPGIELLVDTGLAAHVVPELPALRARSRRAPPAQGRLRALAHRARSRRSPSRTARTAPVPGPGPACCGSPRCCTTSASRRPGGSSRGGGVSFHHHEMVGAKLTAERLRALRFDKDTVREVARLVELHLRFHGYGDGGLDRLRRPPLRHGRRPAAGPAAQADPLGLHDAQPPQGRPAGSRVRRPRGADRRAARAGGAGRRPARPRRQRDHGDPRDPSGPRRRAGLDLPQGAAARPRAAAAGRGARGTAAVVGPPAGRPGRAPVRRCLRRRPRASPRGDRRPQHAEQDRQATAQAPASGQGPGRAVVCRAATASGTAAVDLRAATWPSNGAVSAAAGRGGRTEGHRRRPAEARPGRGRRPAAPRRCRCLPVRAAARQRGRSTTSVGVRLTGGRRGGRSSATGRPGHRSRAGSRWTSRPSTATGTWRRRPGQRGRVDRRRGAPHGGRRRRRSPSRSPEAGLEVGPGARPRCRAIGRPKAIRRQAGGRGTRAWTCRASRHARRAAEPRPGRRSPGACGTGDLDPERGRRHEAGRPAPARAATPVSAGSRTAAHRGRPATTRGAASARGAGCGRAGTGGRGRWRRNRAAVAVP